MVSPVQNPSANLGAPRFSGARVIAANIFRQERIIQRLQEQELQGPVLIFRPIVLVPGAYPIVLDGPEAVEFARRYNKGRLEMPDERIGEVYTRPLQAMTRLLTVLPWAWDCLVWFKETARLNAKAGEFVNELRNAGRVIDVQG